MNQYTTDNMIPIKIKPEDRKTFDIVKTLMPMRVRPAMYFGKNYYTAVIAFLSGYACGTNLYEQQETRSWSDIEQDVLQRIEEEYDYQKWNTNLSEKEKFDIYMRTIFGVFCDRYPNYARCLGLV